MVTDPADGAVVSTRQEVRDMPTFMQPFEPQAYALLRIVAGLLFLWHGTQKLFAFPTAPPPVPPFVIYTAGPIELIGGLLVMIGLFAGWAAFLCSGLMAAAYWMVHGTQALFPIQNGGELAVLYCFVFLYIAARGSGIWSVDAARGESAAFSGTPSPVRR
jgi:putative oxidoreductase